MNMKNSKPSLLYLAWTIWGFGALFYLMGFFQRVAPAVMTNELMHDFHISAAALGNLSAYYYYSYVAMQIPTGILADNWGPRRLLTTGAFVAATGILLFAMAPNIFWANLGRFLIGGSVAVAWVSTLKLAGAWFPPKYFAMLSGIALFFGIVGAVFAGPPLRLVVVAFGWRTIMLASAAVTFAVCAGVAFIVRDHPAEKGYAGFTEPAPAAGSSSRRQIISGIIEVLRYPNVWLLFVIGGGIVGGVLTFGGLWGVPFLSTHHGLTTTQAAALNSTLLVAWGVGGPIFGGLSDRIGRRKPLFIAGCSLTVIGWSLILFIPHLTGAVLAILLLITGFTSGCVVISFAFARESVPAHLAGTVIGMTNMGFMLGPTLLQPAVGWMLDRNWTGGWSNGVKIYSLHAYRTGFTLMIVWALLSFGLLLFTRETYCRPKSN
jgi:MFS family permease